MFRRLRCARVRLPRASRGRAGPARSISKRGVPARALPEPARLRVEDTRIGAGSRPGTIRFVVDFAERRGGEQIADSTAILRDAPPEAMLEPELSASAGTLIGPFLQANPHLPGTRVVFELDPGQERLVELRLNLRAEDEPLSETWLYRWCA